MNTQSFTDLMKPVTEWARAQGIDSRHSRPLILALGAVIFVTALVFVNSGLNSSLSGLRRSQADLSNLSRQLSEGSWEDRRRQSDALRVTLTERFWKAETAGLAEATLERWLRDHADKYGVKPDSIRIQRSNVSAVAVEESSKAGLKGVQRMTAKMNLPFQPEAVMQLLDDAARNDKILIVDRLFIRAGRNALVEIDLSTFIRLDDPVAAR